MELKLKHIQNHPLQGNNLKVVDPNGYTASIVGIITTDPFAKVDFDTAQDDVIIRVMYEDGTHKPDYDFATWGISQIKPLLLPMSSLYTKMEDGKVPIVEMAKVHDPDLFVALSVELSNKNPNMGHVDYVTNDGIECRFGFYNSFQSGYINPSRNRFVNNELDLFTYLFEHHFDVFGLIDKGLALDKTKIK